jgi:hypothetical protein
MVIRSGMGCIESRKHEKRRRNFEGELQASEPRDGDNTPMDIRRKKNYVKK